MMPLENEMKLKSKKNNEKTTKDVECMEYRYVEPVAGYPGQSSLFTKTTVLINSLFGKLNLPNGHVPRYLSGAGLNK
jgi:hypothetical protein